MDSASSTSPNTSIDSVSSVRSMLHVRVGWGQIDIIELLELIAPVETT